MPASLLERLGELTDHPSVAAATRVTVARPDLALAMLHAPPSISE